VLIPIPSSLGYPALAGLVLGESAGVPLPGETAILTAGGLAAGGHLSLPVVILVAALAATLGDTLGFLLGRRGGRRFLLRDGRFADHRRHAVRRADAFFARWGVLAVVFGRWVPGVRIVAALTAGAARMPWPRFAVANAAGALAWAASVAGLAALAGPRWSFALVGVGLALAPLTALVAWWRVRRARRVAAPVPTVI
jgi:undecaprenyl-diphosphatase